jgi:hypothetical protein
MYFSNIHEAPAEGNLCDTNGKAIKPQIVTDYNRHVGNVDKEGRMFLISNLFQGFAMF